MYTGMHFSFWYMGLVFDYFVCLIPNPLYLSKHSHNAEIIIIICLSINKTKQKRESLSFCTRSLNIKNNKNKKESNQTLYFLSIIRHID